MAAKAGPTPPIDRPVSKSYVRDFGGWSTYAPPGVSEPNTLRIMENCWVTRDGALAIRPALRSILDQDFWLADLGLTVVGGFEPFYLSGSRKALLFAARQQSGDVAFHVAVENAETGRYSVYALDDGEIGFEIPQDVATISFSSATTFVRYLQIDNKILALSDAGESVRYFEVGGRKRARVLTQINQPSWDNTGGVLRHPDASWINGAQDSIPTTETPITSTLVSSTAANNNINVAVWYAFFNELGEARSSSIYTTKVSRSWSQWEFFAPAADGAKGSSVQDPKKARDQLVFNMSEHVYNTGRSEGAIGWNLYMATWSDQDAMPAEGVLVGSRLFSDGSDPNVPASTHAREGWIQITSVISEAGVLKEFPTQANRVNYTAPITARQGLVAGDRLILVNDSTNGALIRWSSNQIGDYTNFSPVRGGGQKTLSSGNLLIPVSVKLWQNPQSTDTITILCSGVDSYSTSYYMAPATVDGMTSSTAIMGFEETTATPGTVSPYGVEVFNNALYHPLDMELMKSTASNYNITHRTMTELIANKWAALINKEHIISSQHDNRLYYLVHNPDGEDLIDGCNGNELWVLDAGKEGGSWSRMLIQGISLQRLFYQGRLFMAVTRPDGIFVLDENAMYDETPSGEGGTQEMPIEWRFETNTLGANRAHDAFAHVVGAAVSLGNWRGSLEWGVRGRDRHGKMRTVKKDANFEVINDFDERPLPFDMDDALKIKRDLKEWTLFAGSVKTEDGTVKPSYGQFSFVQFRYTPLSVNLETEFGSVETFEYGASAQGYDSYTTNGIPLSFIEPRR